MTSYCELRSGIVDLNFFGRKMLGHISNDIYTSMPSWTVLFENGAQSAGRPASQSQAVPTMFEAYNCPNSHDKRIKILAEISGVT